MGCSEKWFCPNPVEAITNASAMASHSFLSHFYSYQPGEEERRLQGVKDWFRLKKGITWSRTSIDSSLCSTSNFIKSEQQRKFWTRVRFMVLKFTRIYCDVMSRDSAIFYYLTNPLAFLGLRFFTYKMGMATSAFENTHTTVWTNEIMNVKVFVFIFKV